MDSKEFAKRRKQLMRMMGDGAIAILPAAPQHIRNRDAEYPYRQDSDFHYLSGFPEPEAVIVLTPGRKHGEYILFCRERDPLMETWNGRRAGPEGACELYGADDAFPIGDIDDILPGLLEHRERVYYTMGFSTEFDQRVMGWVNQIRLKVRAGSRTPDEFISLEHLLHDMRLYKSPAELKALRSAMAISATAHQRAMRMCRPGLMEYEVEAEYLHEFRKHGAVPAYSPIVGGGANGCILHYVENNMALNDGELLLIDAGAEVECYAADITRTFPVNGTFSKPQRAIYEVVLAAQQAAIAKIKPGNHWNDPHDAALRVLTEGLVELGLLKGKVRQLIKDQEYRRFYMHRTGHWLGMDVHDVGAYKLEDNWRALQPGMAFTVEPGCYIRPADDVPQNLWNIGIRIEDNVVITEQGCEVLTEAAPKTVAAIEELMRQP